MLRKLALVFALIALVPFTLAACGDDEEDTDTAATTEETTPAPEEDAAAGGGGGATASFTADPNGELAFLEDEVTTQAGNVTVELTNQSDVPHDVRIESGSEEIGGTEVITSGQTAAQVELEPGEYTYFCSVPGHREAGMEGPLTAE